VAAVDIPAALDSMADSDMNPRRVLVPLASEHTAGFGNTQVIASAAAEAIVSEKSLVDPLMWLARKDISCNGVPIAR
jgi:hypothetical protein